MNRWLTGLARLPGPGFPDEEKVDDSGDELEKESTQLAETHKL